MIGRQLVNRIQNAYANRRNYAMTAQKALGAGKKLINALGRANEFANSIGISNPKVSGAVGALQKYGNPIADFASGELDKVGN